MEICSACAVLCLPITVCCPLPTATADYKLRTTSRYNSFALRCSRITRSDRELRICILYFCLCTLIRNNKSAITNSRNNNCPLRLPTADCKLRTTSRYNSFARGCSRITRSDRALRICILYFCLCTFNSLCSLCYTLLSNQYIKQKTLNRQLRTFSLFRISCLLFVV